MNNVDNLLNDPFVNELEEDEGSIPSKNGNQFNITKSVYDSKVPAYAEIQDLSDEHLEVIQSYIDAHNQLRK